MVYRDPATNNRVQNVPQLITYADRLAGDLDGLARLLDGPLQDAFGGVHVLPFFMPIDGADAGFDPIDHTAVDPRVGDWDSIRRVGANRDLMADLIVNHVSADSEQFRSWLAEQEKSPYDGMFLTYSSVYPDGADEAELLRIYRPRPGLPFTPFIDGARTSHLVWTTFTSNQVDVDTSHQTTWSYLISVLDSFQAAGVNLVRLDAIGYAVKKPGTNSFMIPETFEFAEKLASACRGRGMEVLVEVHGHYRDQLEIAKRVDLVYDFALPPLVLDALYRGTAVDLKRWIGIRPTNCVTVLDTHDGIGIIDIKDLVAPDVIANLVAGIHERSGGSSELATGTRSGNLDIYQINCTYYDALGRDDDQYVLARLLQLLLPGVPQIYYMGLLAGQNDVELLTKTGVGRDINRHYYSNAEATEALDQPVVKRLLELFKMRASHPAFNGTFELFPSADTELSVRWVNGDDHLSAHIDFAAAAFTIDAT